MMILHVDGDGFFAACEVARRPDLRGKPVVVGEDRGIACAMTYEAKRLGITRAKPIFEIKREFPQVVILPSHFELYEQYSEKLYRILRSHLESVEWYSIDECFALVPESFAKRHGSWEHAIRYIKEDVQEKLGITFSFGLAETKVLAKVASGYQKPDGCMVLFNDKKDRFLMNTEIGDIWGIGWRLSKKLRMMGVKTAYQFVETPRVSLERQFAEPLIETWQELHGYRVYDVRTKDSIQKSLQATRSFVPASSNKEFVLSELSRNVEIICRRLRDQKLATRKISVFLKSKALFNRFRTASVELDCYTQSPSDILRALRQSYYEIFDPKESYRATGITVYELIPEYRIKQDLFGFQESATSRGLHFQIYDAIQDKYGNGTISLASSMKSILKRKREQEDRNSRDSYIWRLPLPYMGEVF